MVVSQRKLLRRRCHVLFLAGACAVAAVASSQAAHAQQTGLDLAAARTQARRTNPDVAAARAVVDAAAGRERQAGALPNPVLTYSREQTSPNSQDIAALEQRVELGGQRAARVAAARLRRAAAEARLAQARADLDLEVARRFATAVAARQRAQLAAAAAEQFRLAVTGTEHRLAGGDVSGYEARRIRLEAARYAALAAEASLAEREATIRLQTLLGGEAAGPVVALSPLTAVVADTLTLSADPVAAAAIAHSAELRAAALDAEATAADARLAARERVPSPALTAGYKRERSGSGAADDGFIAGVALPLPLWDRRGGAVQAAEAETRRATANLAAVRARVGAEARYLAEAVRRADEQVATLRAALGEEARAAIRAAEAAYAEGEITLVEWLDAVRAYHEAEWTYAAVLADSFMQRAALERMLGVTLIQ